MCPPSTGRSGRRCTTKKKDALRTGKASSGKNRPAWAFVYRQQKQEHKELDETRTSRLKALLYFLRHRQELKSPGGLAWLFQGLAGYHGVDFLDAMNKRHEADRKRLSDRIGRETREAIAEENELYRTELEALRHGQAAERQTLRDEYARQIPARPRAEEKSRRAPAGEERAEKPDAGRIQRARPQACQTAQARREKTRQGTGTRARRLTTSFHAPLFFCYEFTHGPRQARLQKAKTQQRDD